MENTLTMPDCPCPALDDLASERETLLSTIREQEDTIERLRRQIRLLRQLASWQGRGELMTMREIADAHGTTVATIRSWRDRYSDFPPGATLKLGTTLLYDREAVESWIAKHRWKRRRVKPASEIREEK